MKTPSHKFLTLLCIFISSILFSQISISYGSDYLFGNLAVKEASISDKGISLMISELDTRNGNEQDGNNNIKPHYQLILDINSINNLKFPVVAKDSMMFNTTSLQQNLNFNLEVNQFIKSKKGKQLKTDSQRLKDKAASKQEKINALTKRIANGDMTAMKELEKITNELSSEAENIMDKIDIKEEEEKSTFDITFIDTKTLVENKLLSGKIYIKEFNKNKFVAEFSGNFITECLSQKQDCNTKTSTLIPEIKTLKEGKVKGSIHIVLDKVYDDR